MFTVVTRIDNHADSLLFKKFTVKNDMKYSYKCRTEMTIITALRYQGNALTDTFNADRVQCLTLLVHTSTNQWRSQEGGARPPEIGFTRKFLAAPLS